MSATSTVGCNVYAPNAVFSLSSNSAVYGALFTKSLSSSGAATVHYDTSVLRADDNPCTDESCATNGTCIHTPATNGFSEGLRNAYDAKSKRVEVWDSTSNTQVPAGLQRER